MVYCPFGIDTQLLMSIAKLLLIGASAEPEILSLLADTSIEKGKSLDMFKESFMSGVERLESEVVKKWQTEAGQKAISVDVQNADLLYVALAGAHSIIPAAAVFNAAGLPLRACRNSRTSSNSPAMESVRSVDPSDTTITSIRSRG